MVQRREQTTETGKRDAESTHGHEERRVQHGRKLPESGWRPPAMRYELCAMRFMLMRHRFR